MPTDITTLRLHAHFDEGSGPAIVMLHGINSDGGDWRTVMDTIGPGYRFIAFDLLGFGKSPKPLDIDYSADEHALVIDNTLRDLGVDEQFLLVGYSLGGDIALRYASTYPDKLRRLFLLDAPFYLPASELKVSSLGIKYLFDVGSQKVWNLLATSKTKDLFLYKIATGVAQKTLEDAFHADDIPTHWDIMSKNLTNTVNAATWVDDLPKLNMPVVHAIGVHDAIVPISQAPALKRLKPDLEIRRINGWAADHMTLWNMPERVAAEIMRDEVRELNVVWRGGTGEPLVLLHGLRNPGTAWIPAARALATRYDVAVLDLLGFGDSPAPASSHYALADHVAPVLSTVRVLWGDERRVTFAGEGLGATIALGCAATMPERSAGVVAFSAGLLEPETTLDDLVSDERSARFVAMQDAAKRLADANRRGRVSEEADARLAAMLRSVEAGILGTDAEQLLADTPAPVRFITPRDDTLTPARWLEQVCEQREDFEQLVVDGERGLPYERPGEAVRGIAPDAADAIAAAEGAVPEPGGKAVNPIFAATAGVERTLLRTGLLNLGAAAVVLVLHPINATVLTLGFAAWVLVASLSAIVGALGMRRRTAGTRFSFTTTALPVLLLGLGGLVLASFLFADPAAGRRFFGIAIAVYATARGASDLWVARKVRDTAKPRWLLFSSALLGLGTAASILFGPNHGVGVVRLSLAAYLGLSGAALIAYVNSARRASKLRVKALLGKA